MDNYILHQNGRLFTTPNSEIGIAPSIKQTLGSIENCCKLGNFSDAFILLRKYRDDLFFCLYIDAMYEDDKKTNDNKHFEEIESLWFPRDLTQKKQENSESLRIKRVGYQDCIKKIYSSVALSKIVNKYNLKTELKCISDRLNDFVHGNHTLNRNNTLCYNKLLDQYEDSELSEICKNFVELLEYITVVFVFFNTLRSLDSIRAIDYIDSISFNTPIPNGSEYWVAPFIKKFFYKHASKLDENCILYLKSTTGMLFD